MTTRTRLAITVGGMLVFALACYVVYVVAWLLAQPAWTPPTFRGLWY